MKITPLKYLIILVVIFSLITGGLFFWIDQLTNSGIPSLQQLENPKQNLATQVYSADGKLLDHFFAQRRVALPYDSIPQDFIHGLIATEDRAFFDHWGVHLKRVFSAMVKNVLAGGIREGASTITMQLARNLFLNHETTFKRKIREAYVAVQIEKTYTKEEILELYSNTVAFGRGAYGIQVASRIYFDKDPSELTTAECAFLVGILKTPERYNGRDMDLALSRRNLVLKLMYQQGYITGANYSKSIKEPITLKTGEMKKSTSFFAPHFVEMVRQELSKTDIYLGRDYDLYRDGLIIHTTINTKIQKYANEAVAEHLKEFQQKFDRNWNWKWHKDLLEKKLKGAIHDRADYKAASKKEKKAIEKKLMNDKSFVDSVKNVATTIQTGLTVIDPYDGRILAMVGASPKYMKEHADSKYSLNHVTQIRRQPGSAFKPFVYSLVIEKGVSPDTLIECGPYSYKLITGDVWSPRNSSGKCDSGDVVTLRDGLRKSINTVAARLVTKVTNPRDVVSLLRRCGVFSPLHAVPAIALGAGGEVKPIELVSAYGTFAFEGYHVEPYFITRIEDSFGNVLYRKNESRKIRDAMDKSTAFTMTRLMMGVVESGTAWRVKKYLPDVDIAGKTGTTNDYTDAWFVGFTPELVAGCWVGFDDQRVSFGPYGQGGTAAAPIIGRLLAKVYNDVTLPFTKTEFDLPKPDTTRIPNIDVIMQNDSNIRLRRDSGMRHAFPPLPNNPDGDN